MGIDRNSFFITAPFATDELRAKVAEDKLKLEGIEAEYALRRDEFVSLCGDLTVMEEKSGFLERQIVRSMTIFDLPPDGDHAREMARGERVYDALMWTGTLTGAASGVLLIVGKMGIARTVKASMAVRSVGTMKKIKAGAKLGRSATGAGRAVIGAANAARVTRATQAAKLGKFGKLAKLGKATGILSAAVVLIDVGLRMASAAKMNQYFIDQSAEINAVIAQANGALTALNDGIAEGKAMRAKMLEDAGCASVVAYLDHLNRAIADVGRLNARRALVRRMLIDGMDATMAARYSELPESDVSELARKLRVDQALLAGTPVADIARAQSVSASRVDILSRLFGARLALLDGVEPDGVADQFGLSDVSVSGVATSLARDLRQAWALFARGESAADVAAATVLPEAAMSALATELAAKRRLLEGEPPASIANDMALAVDTVASWQSMQADVLGDARDAVRKLERSGRATDVAADYRLPPDFADLVAEPPARAASGA